MRSAEASRVQPWRIGLALVATAVVFAIDLQTPWGVASWILYAVPLVLLCYPTCQRYLIPFAALVSALIVVDHFLSASQAPWTFSVFNRAAGLVALWAAVWLLLRREQANRALELLRDTLEIKVAERTAELQAANDSLSRAAMHCRTSEAQMRAVLEHSSDIVTVYDANLIVRYVNSSVTRLLGCDPGELLGSYGLAVVHPEDAPGMAAAFARVLADPTCVERREVRLRHKDGRYLWFESVGHQYPGEAGARSMVVNSRDITERKEAERLSIESLVRHRDALVREVHHRIKNNLQGVIGLLARQARERPELAASMQAAIARVNAIATLHGLYAGSMDSRVNLCEISAAIGEYMGALFPGVALRTDTPADWRKVRLNEQEAVAVALVVNELLLNAAKSCEHEHCTEPVTVRVSCDGGEVVVSVVNAAGRLPEGFDFASAHGIGTGLTLVRSLLPPQGARLAIRQLEPQGVEARLCLSAPVVVEG